MGFRSQWSEGYYMLIAELVLGAFLQLNGKNHPIYHHMYCLIISMKATLRNYPPKHLLRNNGHNMDTQTRANGISFYRCC